MGTAGEAVAEGRDRAAEAAAALAEAAAEGAQNATEAVREKSRRLMLEHYRPVFPADYLAPDYDLPKMIIVVDEDTRKGVEVCEGAIGWFSDDDDLEVLHLYESAIEMSGLTFFPRPVCDSTYFVDPFDDGRYLNLAKFFEILHQDQVTELRSIAHALGARECRLESYSKTVERKAHGLTARAEATKKKGKKEKKGAREGLSAESCGELARELERSQELTLEFHQTFEDVPAACVPPLRWFAEDKEIEFLIKTRCEEGLGRTAHYSLNVDSSVSSFMSGKLASKIDATLSRCHLLAAVSMEEQVEVEMRRRLQFVVDF